MKRRRFWQIPPPGALHGPVKRIRLKVRDKLARWNKALSLAAMAAR